MPKSVTFKPSLAVDEHVVRLDVAVDDAVPVREAQRREDLPRVVDCEVDRRRSARDDQLLERAPIEVLHRDVVGALRLAAVVDRDDVRMREAGGVLRLAAEALDELVVARVAVVQDLDRDAAAEHLVLGEVDVRHPARAELAHDAVAPVEERVDQGVGNRHRGLFRVGIRPYRSSASITCLAIGAEIVPPKPLSWFSTTTAIATRGAFDRREGREPRRVDVARARPLRCRSSPRR